MKLLRLAVLVLMIALSGSLAYTQGGVGSKPKTTAVANKVDGLELPANMEVDRDEDSYVVVTPKIDLGWKVEKLDWIVVSISEKSIRYDEIGNGLVLGLPQPGEVVFVYADALLSQNKKVEMDVEYEGKTVKAMVPQKIYKKTPHAVTLVKVKNKSIPATNTPQPGTMEQPVVSTPTAIPQFVGPLHVIVVMDFARLTTDQQNLANSNVWKTVLEKTGSRGYVYDINSDTISKKQDGILRKLVDKAGGSPAVIILNKKGQPLPAGQAIRVPVTNDVARNELILLDIVGRAAGGK